MSWQYHVGQRVVCIEDDWGFIQLGGHDLPARVPMLNEVLTVVDMKWCLSGVVEHPRPWDVEGLFLTFAEIPLCQSVPGWSARIRWIARKFRPLEERKTDISIFTRMLTGNRVDA